MTLSETMLYANQQLILGAGFQQYDYDMKINLQTQPSMTGGYQHSNNINRSEIKEPAIISQLNSELHNISSSNIYNESSIKSLKNEINKLSEDLKEIDYQKLSLEKLKNMENHNSLEAKRNFSNMVINMENNSMSNMIKLGNIIESLSV